MMIYPHLLQDEHIYHKESEKKKQEILTHMQQLLHFLKSIFSDNFQKSNICPIHKKRGKQKVNNYSLIITNIWRNI